jgi:hypothetical protein
MGERYDLVDEREEVSLLVLDPAREEFRPRGVHHVRPVEPFADVYSRPSLLLHDLPLRRPRLLLRAQEFPPAAPYAANYPRGSLP